MRTEEELRDRLATARERSTGDPRTDIEATVRTLEWVLEERSDL